ncbi:MAG: thermonuclease family protein [Pirellulales bacterium]
MKTLVLFCLLALPTLAADTTIVGKVVGVHDGDTLTLRTEDETLKVRLSGIDTPELGQPFGNNAKQALSGMAFGKSVTISSTGKDRYGRTLGTVFSQDKGNVNYVKCQKQRIQREPFAHVLQEGHIYFCQPVDASRFFLIPSCVGKQFRNRLLIGCESLQICLCQVNCW